MTRKEFDRPFETSGFGGGMSLADHGLLALAFFGALAYGHLTGRAEGYRRGYRQAERDRYEGNDE